MQLSTTMEYYEISRKNFSHLKLYELFSSTRVKYTLNLRRNLNIQLNFDIVNISLSYFISIMHILCVYYKFYLYIRSLLFQPTSSSIKLVQLICRQL